MKPAPIWLVLLLAQRTDKSTRRGDDPVLDVALWGMDDRSSDRLFVFFHGVCSTRLTRRFLVAALGADHNWVSLA